MSLLLVSKSKIPQKFKVQAVEFFSSSQFYPTRWGNFVTGTSSSKKTYKTRFYHKDCLRCEKYVFPFLVFLFIYFFSPRNFLCRLHSCEYVGSGIKHMLMSRSGVTHSELPTASVLDPQTLSGKGGGRIPYPTISKRVRYRCKTASASVLPLL